MPNWPVYISSISAPIRLSCLTPEQRTFVWIYYEKRWFCGRCGCFIIWGQSGFSEILLSSDNNNDLNKIVIEYSQTNLLIVRCKLNFICPCNIKYEFQFAKSPEKTILNRNFQIVKFFGNRNQQRYFAFVAD